MPASSGVTGALVAVVVLVVTTGFGLWWRGRQGRFAAPADPRAAAAARSEPAVTLSELGVCPDTVTLLQFSSRICAPCRATSRVLGDVVRDHPGVDHVEVDVQAHPEAVDALGVRRTPTLLVLDRTGRVVQRASGLPTRAAVEAALRPLLTPA